MTGLTHLVAAAVYIFRNDKLLLLKRVSPPQTFAPPGGRLLVNEDPLVGALRETKEETGLTPEIIEEIPIPIWFGEYSRGLPPLLCVNYLATCDSDQLQLSAEHSDFLWVTRNEIESGIVQTLDDQGRGYQPASFLDAFDRYDAWASHAKR